MKKVLDLTNCKTTEDICDALEQEIAKNEELQPKKKSLKSRVVSWFKQLFHK